jgi:large subunit ribosomal protein L5
MSVQVRLKDYYREKAVPALMKSQEYKNIMQVPRLEKIVLNVGDGEFHANQKLLDAAIKELKLITGRKPIVNKAKKAISNFKLRKGMAVGVSVTLRGDIMWEFLDRLITIYLPRVRDFRGISDKSFDGHGNYSIGVREQVIFTEIDYDKIEKVHGLDINIVTTARNDKEARALLEELGIPFVKRQAS